jgi:hypothetical protein
MMVRPTDYELPAGYPPGMSIVKRDKLIRETLVAALETHEHADGDFSGEQREWHLPRINKIAANLMLLFPEHLMAAFEVAKDAHGNRILDK